MSVLIIGFTCARIGIRLFERGLDISDSHALTVRRNLQTLRSRSAAVFVLMVLIYVQVSFIPFIGGVILGADTI